MSTRVWVQSRPVELVHWSWLTASDGYVWARQIDAFNEAHKDKGERIKLEVVPLEQGIAPPSPRQGRPPMLASGQVGPAVFSRSFKMQYGRTPREFRELLRRNQYTSLRPEIRRLAREGAATPTITPVRDT
ncbi:hypothetical protein P1J78_03030 [Psychromarinibacter sp. C21-152]|uniref:HTH araC/xylS-type domain-containing protein n=1 Tax=Psychromarinibacter sediminicola TaxID=3033385 RepID=A0AAE3NLV7_9RHOB|nr:hypothetical protein [Psychromarinibacter sediminicola]MDF0599698.1 hypothetical protein [Psychromarinibacter sediminicola]